MTKTPQQIRNEVEKRKKKKYNVNEIRNKLHKLQMEMIGNKGHNKLVTQYISKVQYMLMWMRLIPIDKKTLKGWSMPDMGTISKFSKEVTSND